MKFCPVCRNYLYHQISDKTLERFCKTCGHRENDTEGGLVMETTIQERASESYKILLNEFTRLDPTLPHTKEIKCPNATCPSNKEIVQICVRGVQRLANLFKIEQVLQGRLLHVLRP